MKKAEMVGKRFGKLVVEMEHSKTRNGHIRFVCTCDCGKKSNVLGTHLRQGNTKSCGCDMYKSGSRNKMWTGIGDLSGDFWHNHVVRSAAGVKGRRKIELSITKEYAWDLFLKQNKKCALTNEILIFPKSHSDKSWTASLDRINSEIGYLEGNVQWVHKNVNMMKNKFTQEYFIQTCSKISKNFYT